MRLFFTIDDDPWAQIEHIRKTVECGDHPGVREVEIDLRGVDIPDSGFMSRLLAIHLALKGRGIDMSLVNVGTTCRKVFSHCYLDQVVTIEDAV